MKEFRDFESAREFVRSLNLKGQMEWHEYCKSGDKPDNIPSRPERFYKNDFKGVDDWLGTGRAPPPKEFVVFTKAREFARSLKLKNRDQWEEYCRSGKKPNYIFSRPNSKYKKEWKGWGDFLGTGNIQNQQRQYRSFLEAREFVRSLNLKSLTDWNELAASNKLPNDIPHSPEHQYKNKGWKGAGDFLGTGTVAPQNKQYRSFVDTREFVRKLNIRSSTKWYEYCKSGNKPDDIPTGVWNTYKKEWTTWGEFLGTGTIAPYNIQYRSFKEARQFVRRLGLKGIKEWGEYCKSGNKPDDIPANPWATYKEWKKK